jgi:transcriptional regulator with XRE-family HTH domain
MSNDLASTRRQLGETLREARVKAGLTQADLAANLDVTQVAVSKWENGHNDPTVANLRQIADVLRLDLGDFDGLL